MGPVYKKRRQSLAKMAKDGLILIPSGTWQTRSHDTTFPFRQDSHFYYLTGCGEPRALLVMEVNDGTSRDLLFLPKRDPLHEAWNGPSLGPEQAKEVLGIEGRSHENFQESLNGLVKGHTKAYFDLHNPVLMPQVLKACQDSWREKAVRPQSFHHIDPLLGCLRLIKDSEELHSLKMAARATTVAHRAAMAFARAEKNEADVAAFLEFILKQEGAEGTAYLSIVAGGPHGLTLHYIDNNAPLKKGETLLIDAGGEVNLYASDVTRTFPIDGQFTPPQKELYSLVLEAQKKAIEASRPGAALHNLHKIVETVFVEGLIDLNILKGPPSTLLEEGALRPYFPHKTSHWIGLDVHDNAPYTQQALSPGMVYTIEPGLYLPFDDKVPRALQGLAVRIEDDILITPEGSINLTEDAPKEISAIHEACGQDYRTFLS